MGTTDSPKVKGSSPDRGKFFAVLHLFLATMQFWQIRQNDLFAGKLDYEPVSLQKLTLFFGLKFMKPIVWTLYFQLEINFLNSN